MILESFLKSENVNIKDLTLEKEKEPVSESQKMYEMLKTTALHDEKTGQWNRCMGENQKLSSPQRLSSDQLLGVLAEACFDAESAKEKYEVLKKQNFYNKQQNRWNFRVGSDQDLGDSSDKPLPQLYNFLAEASIYNTFDKKRYEDFRKKFYNQERNLWIFNTLNPKGILVEGSDIMLSGILVEALFDKESARVKYEALKLSRLYDIERKQWNEYNENLLTRRGGSSGLINDRSSAVQLLGILAEAKFDRKSAKELFKVLKETKLYDKNKKQWNVLIRENQIAGFGDRFADAQLLGVLAEDLFEEKNSITENQRQPIPETKKY